MLKYLYITFEEVILEIKINMKMSIYYNLFIKL